ncbi:MAG: DNA polymerase I [Thermoleophilaceae bacterium]|nr:DNA polymerase I [Thermoleophilaceae bacterium]
MVDAKRKLYLIDGNSLAYRAFFAIPDTFISSKGLPTNALFGLASMYLKVVDEHGHPAVAVIWDAGMSGREQIFPEYKGTRDAQPEPLKEQRPHFAPLSEAFGFINYSVEGWEADDVIATIAQNAYDLGYEVVVVTGDRDAFQLANDRITIMATARGVTDTKMYTPEAVLERYGIGPELVPDFYGMKGDTSDNIPGVPGIGEKTASALLQEFGSLENILASVDKISGAKRKENLINHADDARMSRDLATLTRDIPTPDFDLDAVMAEKLDPSRLRDALREYELREPLRRLERFAKNWDPSLLSGDMEMVGGSDAAARSDVVAPETGSGSHTESAVTPEPATTASPSSDGALQIVPTTVAELARLATGETVAMLRALDAADDGPAATLMADAALESGTAEVGFALIKPGAIHVGTAPTADDVAVALGHAMLITHDLKNQLASTKAPVPALVHDTQIAAYLIDSARRQYALREMAAELGLTVDLIDTNSDAAKATDPRLLDLAADTAVIPALAAQQAEQVEELKLTYLLQEVELPLVAVLLDVERAGLTLDTDALADAAKGFNGEIDELEKDIYELAGKEFTIGSPKQLAPILFEELGLAHGRKGKTGYSTDARVLASLRDAHPIIEKIERWRELSKLRSTYVEALPKLVSPEDGRIHTTLQQTRTATGRLSSINPNLQNIPVRTPLGQKIRECFVAAEGCTLTSADYSQVELRVLAHVAGDEAMRDIFRRGEDVHSATAAEIFGIPLEDVDHATRDRAKAVNFGIIYGLSAFGLSDRLKIPRDEAAEFIKRYLGRFEAVEKFMANTIEQAKRDGYVTTLLGRRRAIPELASSQVQMRNLGERLAVNTVVQGTSADIIKLAMIRAEQALRKQKLTTRMVLQIHDELLFEGPHGEAEEVAALAKREMETAYAIDPPLIVEVGSGPNWLAAK